MRGDLVLLVTAQRRLSRYVPLIAEAIAAFWPNHPPVRYLTDGGFEEGGDIYVEEETAFVPLLARGLQRIRKDFPNAKRVFHLLEDHSPLKPCDGSRIAAIGRIAAAHDLPTVVFPTYPWPWTKPEPMQRPRCVARVWDQIEFVTIDEEKFAAVPRNFDIYFQIQPTIWRLDYLQSVCEHAASIGVTDPWSFEKMRPVQEEQHFVSAYRWPTVQCGFMMRGRVNPRAIEFAAHPSAARIRGNLIRDQLGIDSEILFHLRQHAARRWRAIKKRTRRAARAVVGRL
jgi:hypothetical protein